MRFALISLTLLLVVPSIQAASIEPDHRRIQGQYIVRFEAPPVSRFAGEKAKDGSWRLEPTAPGKALDSRRFDPRAKAVVTYRQHLRATRAGVLDQAELLLGRQIKVLGTTDLTSHVAVVSLSGDEAAKLATMDGIATVEQDVRAVRHTDTGPGWIRAPLVWAGISGVPATRGEGVVIGILDGGINPANSAFADPSPEGYDHVNPFGTQLGTCSSAQVQCNDKLVGVYDFTDDAGQIGLDTDGHGSHVASVAAGNERTTEIGITATEQIALSGVAPRANIISYKVCRPDDPTTEPDEDGCPISGILQAIDQAVNDGVEIINLSLGSDPTNPWQASMARELLDARALGTLAVTSAGNAGPEAGTVGTPADAPWTLGVANTTHSRQFQNSVIDLAGGDALPPGDLLGVGLTGAYGPAPIVHARDFGNALCGVGPAELQPDCESHTGSTNPFAPGTFNGEIVVCDRGTYGRVEKGFNLRAAGAGGYILANTIEEGESIVGDDHCLPAVHLGSDNGTLLRNWLDGGGAPQGAIAGLTRLEISALGDIVSASSSRGPNASVPDLLKPELSAPGVNILGASHVGDQATFLSGTSFSAPHVAGVAALLKSVYPQLSPSMLHSMLVSTARNVDMRDSNGVTPADGFAVGSGLVRPDLAVRAGLGFEVGAQAFLDADPMNGGAPRELNLPTMQDDDCRSSCTFVRVVQDRAGGGNWTASLSGPDGLVVDVDPATFTLAAGETQELSITVDVSTVPALAGQWVHGALLLIPEDTTVSATRMPFAVNSSTGDLPERIVVTNADARGSERVEFADLVALPDAEYVTAGLAPSETRQRTLAQDPTRSDPYDSFTDGVFFELVQASGSARTIIAHTVPQNNGDLDLFVGFDANANGLPEAEEELCRSTSSTASEECLIDAVSPGAYWILVQNWASQVVDSNDVAIVRYATITDDSPTLTATGPGQPPADVAFDVRLIWNDGRMRPGETWFGTLTPKSTRGEGAGELGVIPVEITLASATPVDPGTLDRAAPYAMAPSDAARFELQAGEGHGRLFVDVPPGAQRLEVTAESGKTLDLHVVRQDFDSRATVVPDAVSIADALQSSTGDVFHQIVIETPSAGRYHLVPVNTNDSELSVRIGTSITPGDASVTPRPGLYFNPQRSGAGFNLNEASNGQLIIEWYTYLEDDTPVWYLAQAARSGNQWTADLLQFRWNGSEASPTRVGIVVLTFIDSQTLAMSFRVNGESGTEQHISIGPEFDCAEGVDQTGLWFVQGAPGYGFSIQSGQVHINYLYDGFGFPRWVLGQSENMLVGVMELGQFSGFCPTCAIEDTSSQVVGLNDYIFDGEGGVIATDVVFVGSVPGQWLTGGELQNLTPVCAPASR